MTLFEQLYACTVLRWDEPDEEGNTVFEVVARGVLVRADSLPLLMAALTPHPALSKAA